MGAWGIGIFENDGALDWSAEPPTLDKIELTLNGLDWTEEEELDEPWLDEPEILAAADCLDEFRRGQSVDVERAEALVKLAIYRLEQFLDSNHYQEYWKDDLGAKRAVIVREVVARLEKP